MKKQLYLDIKNQLKTIKNKKGELLFKHFDLWNQQVEFIEQETPFACPAIFVEFLPHRWRTLSGRVQDAELTIRLHIVTLWHSGTADYSPTESKALYYLDIVDKVVKAMQNFSATNSNSFMRSQSIPNHNHETYVDSIEEYVCNITDTSAVRKTIMIKPEPIVTKYTIQSPTEDPKDDDDDNNDDNQNIDN